MQSASSSSSHSGLMRPFTSTNVQAGRMAEKNSPCARGLLPARYVGQHDTRAHDAAQGQACIGHRLSDDFKAASGLTVDVADRRDTAPGSYGCRAGDGDECPHPDSPRKADLRFERRA